MSDRLKPTPDSVVHSIMRHPRVKAIGTLALSTAITAATFTPEGSPIFKKVIVGSEDPNVHAQLENHGATLWYAPNTKTAPLGLAEIGAKLTVDQSPQETNLVEEKWIRVILPDVPGKMIQLNHGIQGNEIFPDHAYIKEGLVIGIFETPKK